MDDYTKLCKELIEDEIAERLNYSKEETRRQVLLDLQDDSQNVFGNLDGSRTCSTYEAQQFLDRSGAIWDSEIHDLFDEMGDDYFFDCLKRGAETLDVVILELLKHRVISDMLEETE